MSDTHLVQPAPTPPPLAPGVARASNGLATAGFVLGLLGFLGSFIPVLNVGAIVIGVIGVVLAAVGLAKAKKRGAGKKLAIAGLILGGLSIIIGIVINVAFASAVGDALDEATDTTVQTPADSDKNKNTPKDDDSAEDAVGTSRDNPAPLASAITGGDWTVKVNSVKTAKQDSMSQAPAAGSKLLVINLTATYNGDDPQGASPWASVKFVTAQGNTIDGLDGSTMFIAEDGFDSLTSVFEGASVTGDKIIEVPADWKTGVLAVSPDLLSDDTFVAVQ